MTRAPSYLDDNTSTYARTCPGFGKTAAQQALAIEVHKTPLYKRVLWAFCRRGWATVPALLVASVLLSGCADDLQAHAAVQADLADAIHQAAQEAGK